MKKSLYNPNKPPLKVSWIYLHPFLFSNFLLTDFLNKWKLWCYCDPSVLKQMTWNQAKVAHFDPYYYQLLPFQPTSKNNTIHCDFRSVPELGQGPQRNAEPDRVAVLRHGYPDPRLRRPGLPGVPHLRGRDGLQDLPGLCPGPGKQEGAAGTLTTL